MKNHRFVFYKTFWPVPYSTRLGVSFAVNNELFTTERSKIPIGLLTSTGYADDDVTYHHLLIIVFNLAISFITYTYK
jgi:hypothetical protein